VTRLINQMRFLARDAVVARTFFPLAPLIEEAFRRRASTAGQGGALKYETAASRSW